MLAKTNELAFTKTKYKIWNYRDKREHLHVINIILIVWKIKFRSDLKEEYHTSQPQ